jgi:hypothetical protein
VRLPKPIYEGLPYFLVAVGALFITLVLTGYEYAPTLFIWLLGLFCIIAGVGLFLTRLSYRRQHSDDE